MRKSTTESGKHNHNPGILSTLGAAAVGTALAVGTKAVQVSVNAVDALASLADSPKKAGTPKTTRTTTTRTTPPTRKVAARKRSQIRRRTA